MKQQSVTLFQLGCCGKKTGPQIFTFRRKRKLTEKMMWKMKATFLVFAVTFSISQVFSQLVSVFFVAFSSGGLIDFRRDLSGAL